MNHKLVKHIGQVLAVVGVGMLALKAILPEIIDANGVLHESFYLLPIGFGLTLLGLVILIIHFFMLKSK